MSSAERGRRWLLSSFGLEGDATEYLAMARELVAQGNPQLAATAYDRAYGVASGDATITAERAALLDQLTIVEHGLTFRYIPAGSFLMGANDAGTDLDEGPIHVVELGDYWLSDTPISWAGYCELMKFVPPPFAEPRVDYERHAKRMRELAEDYAQGGSPIKRIQQAQAANNSAKAIEIRETPPRAFRQSIMNGIRLSYCEDHTLHAQDWHIHIPDPGADGVPYSISWSGGKISNRPFTRYPERDNPDAPWTYSQKPMIAVGWAEAEEVATLISGNTGSVTYRLPTEAEWEKGARGGLIGRRYPWGDAEPTPDRCDFGRFEQFAIQPSRRFPSNGYGLYAMSGGVWEWTRDWYDAEYYTHSAAVNPTGPESGTEKVLRGGSWADCAEVLRASFRSSYLADTDIEKRYGMNGTANIGFRLCRVAQSSG
jgi:formylglycine-generating enzyme required for sulfatase activity